MNPNTTLTLLSQPPLLGRFFNKEGKKARTVKGNAKAIENASIVTIGAQNSPLVDFMSTVPTIGPVQENDTRTKVNARKKMPPSPPLSDLLSELFTHLEGSVNSNAPKNEAAKTIKMTKNNIFGSQCVASQLKISAVTVSPPKIRVAPIIIHIGTV